VINRRLLVALAAALTLLVCSGSVAQAIAPSTIGAGTPLRHESGCTAAATKALVQNFVRNYSSGRAPEEGEPEAAQQPATPSIVIYDLPPGATPVLRTPASGAAEAPASAAPEAPSEQAVPDSRVFQYLSPDGKPEMIGMWSPAARGDSPQDVVKAVVSITTDLETSERWRAELAAGRLPQTSEDEP
jgi:hypothetical protein